MAEKNNKNDSDITKNNLSRQTVHSIDPSTNTSRQNDDSEMKMINASNPTKNINTGFKVFKNEEFFDKTIFPFMQSSVSQATSSPQYDSSNPQGHVTHTVDQPSVSQATSSLQDMPINPQGGGVTSRKPTIEEIFSPDYDTVGQRLQQREYHQAYGVSRKLIKLGPAVIESKYLVDHYRCCMLADETEEAIRTKEQLKHLFKEKFQTTPNEIEKFAGTIRGEGRDMEPILFYQIAAEFYGNQSLAGLVGIANCAKGIQQSIKSMLSRDRGLKPIVRTHVISLMRDMREMIRRSDNVSEEDRCLQALWCLRYIEVSEYLVGNQVGGESTCKAIKERVKERAGKSSVYGACLYNLGVTYENTSRPNDACEYYEEATTAYREAEDIKGDERAMALVSCEHALMEIVESQMD